MVMVTFLVTFHEVALSRKFFSINSGLFGQICYRFFLTVDTGYSCIERGSMSLVDNRM